MPQLLALLLFGSVKGSARLFTKMSTCLAYLVGASGLPEPLLVWWATVWAVG